MNDVEEGLRAAPKWGGAGLSGGMVSVTEWGWVGFSVGLLTVVVLSVSTQVRGEGFESPLTAPAPIDGAGVVVEETLPAAIERLRVANAVIAGLGEAEGLNGYLVRPPSGRPYAAYVTSTGAVVVGLLVGPEGEDVTRRQLETARDAGKLEGFGSGARSEAAPSAGGDVGTRVGRLLEATRKVPGFWLGDRGPVIHTFADPTCRYSLEHVRWLARDARAGRLQAHVIPVGVLGAGAAQRAVEIAGAARPGDAWMGRGGGAIDRDVGAVSVGVGLRAHAGWRVRGVPFSVWEGPQGVQVFYGAGEAGSFAGDVVR